VLQPRPSVLVVGVGGELDLATRQDLVRGVDAAAAAHPGQPVVLDLSEVGYIDSCGVHALLDLRQRLGVRLALHAPAPCVARLLSVTNLRDRFAFVEGH